MDTSFRRRADGSLALEDSMEAIRRPRQAATAAYCQPLEKVRRDAVDAVRIAGGGASNQTHVLGQHKMQVGQYHCETFQWILNNGTGYAGWFIDGMRNDQHSSTPLSDNKHTFKYYMLSFPEGKQAVQINEGHRLAKCVPPSTSLSASPTKPALSTSAFHQLYSPSEAQTMVRFQRPRITARQNIPPRAPSLAFDTLSDEMLCAEADTLEQSLHAGGLSFKIMMNTT